VAGSQAGGSALLRRVVAVFSALTVIVTAVCAAGWLAINHLTGNITTVDVSGLLGNRPTAEAPAVAATYPPMNILIMGTDTRTGQGSSFGNAADTSSGTGHSDTVILLHISGDRTRALGVSLPRDSWVTRPACGPNSSGQMVTGKFNTAFAAGGPACTIKAVEYLTHVRIDHFVVVNFLGFESVVNALGGVPICLTHPVYDKKSHFSEPAGTTVLNGTQALAFARLRHNIGDGSDIGREDRQQVFMSSVVRTATGRGVLTNPVRLYEVLDAITKSLTVDPGLGTLDDLKNFAASLSGMTPKMVKFTTVPWVPKGDNQNVLWSSKADRIWQAFRRDTPYPPASAGTTKPVSTLSVPASKIYVKVLNGSGVAGAARQAANELAALGYHIVSVGNAATSTATTTTVSASGASDGAARTLSYSTHGASVSPTGTGPDLVLTIGKNWQTPIAATTSSKVSSNSTTAATQVKSADQASCVG
jgi:LCP family protein required for cell wall assembly